MSNGRIPKKKITPEPTGRLAEEVFVEELVMV